MTTHGSSTSRSFLLLHGMCSTGEVWTNFRNFYEARGIRVFTPTLRPRERVRSKPPATFASLRLADYVADIEQEIERITDSTGQRPTLIGHSMGGLIAQVLAQRNRANAAVFISPTAPADVRDGQQRRFWKGLAIANGLGLVPRELFPYRAITDALVFNRMPAAERDAAHATMVLEPRSVLEDLPRCHVDAAQIRIPVLTVAAGQDRLVPPSIVRLTAKKYASVGGAFKEYPQHGHWLYAEPGWETPATEILEWVEAST